MICHWASLLHFRNKQKEKNNKHLFPSIAISFIIVFSPSHIYLLFYVSVCVWGPLSRPLNKTQNLNKPKKQNTTNSHEKRDVYRFWNRRVKSRWRCVDRHRFMALDRQRVPAIFSNHHQWLELSFRRLHDKLAHGWIDMDDQRHRLMTSKEGGRIEGNGKSMIWCFQWFVTNEIFLFD